MFSDMGIARDGERDKLPAVSVANTLPNELWTSVFESLSREDLLTVIRTCAFFHSIAWRILFRDIVWIDPRQVSQTNTTGVWEKMSPMPRSLTVCLSPPPGEVPPGYTQVMAVPPQGNYIPIMQLPQAEDRMMHSVPEKPFYCASLELYSQVTTRILSFINLSSLEFFRSVLTESFYTIVLNLPSLRKLAIMDCALPTLQEISEPNSAYGLVDFTQLALTDLTLRAIRGDCEKVREDTDVGVRRFMTAPGIRSLNIDWSRNNSWFLQPDNLALTMQLENFEMHEPTKDQWRGDSSHSLMPRLAAFFIQFPTITSVTFPDPVFLSGFRPSIGMLPNLNVYHGSGDTITLLSEGRDNLRELHFHSTFTVVSFGNMVSTLSQNLLKGVHSLNIMLAAWDREIMYPITDNFTNLRSLEIRFYAASPTEQALLSLGGVFLAKMKQLHTLRIYNPLVVFASDLLECIQGAEDDEKRKVKRTRARARHYAALSAHFTGHQPPPHFTTPVPALNYFGTPPTFVPGTATAPTIIDSDTDDFSSDDEADFLLVPPTQNQTNQVAAITNSVGAAQSVPGAPQQPPQPQQPWPMSMGNNHPFALHAHGQPNATPVNTTANVNIPITANNAALLQSIFAGHLQNVNQFQVSLNANSQAQIPVATPAFLEYQQARRQMRAQSQKRRFEAAARAAQEEAERRAQAEQLRLEKIAKGPVAEKSVMELFLPWGVFCRELREVQLFKGVVWRRAGQKDKWMKREERSVQSKRYYGNGREDRE